MAALIGVASLAFAAAYGGSRWWVAAAGGVVLGGLIAWGTAALRWHWLLTVLVTAIAYLLFGAGLAASDSALGGLIPSVESVRRLTLAVVTSWRQMLTVVVPVGASGTLLVPVFLSALVLSAVAGSVITRTRRPLWALVAPVVMFGLAGLFGTDAGYRPLISGGVVAIGGLLWASVVTASRGGAGFSFRRPISAVVVIAAAVAAVAFLGTPVAPAQGRVALRDSITTQFDPHNFPSPLSGFRNYVASDAAKKSPLFTVTGLPDDSMVRLAALDQYDGVAYTVSTDTGTFKRVGDEVSSAVAGQAVSATVTVQNYQGVYLPDIGYLTGIRFEGSDRSQLTQDFRYAPSSGVGVVTSALHQGDSYQIDATVPPAPTPAVMASVSSDRFTGLAAPTKIPDQAKAAAVKYADGVEGDYAKATAMLNGLKAAGHLSHGGPQELDSPSGHGLDRIARLLTDTNEAGDQEQFAVALSLMLWSQQIPNRVVMGFTTGKHRAAPVTVTGSDVTAWVEVPFVGQGWVAFDPTPQQTTKAPQPKPQQQAAPKPQVVQPPPPPPAPDQAKSSDVSQSAADNKALDKKNDDVKPPASAAGPWLGIGIGVGGLLLLIGLLVGIILGLKARRRSARRNAATGDARIAGGWKQLLDTAVDFGHVPTPGLTRSETALELDDRYANGSIALARQADARVFAPGVISDDESSRFWAEVDAALLGLRTSHGRVKRLRARLSLASVRRKGVR